MRVSVHLCLAATLAAGWLFPASLPGQQAAMEVGVDRPGADFKNFELPQAEPKLCMAACRKESNCKAWTYVKPGVQGDKARCWLKDEVPDAEPKDYCVSGVKGSGEGSSSAPSTIEQNTDRPGADYKHFDLPRAEPKLCMAACVNESLCKAWTYVKPGAPGDNAHCWLKDEVPDAEPKDCCVSGVKK